MLNEGLRRKDEGKVYLVEGCLVVTYEEERAFTDDDCSTRNVRGDAVRKHGGSKNYVTKSLDYLYQPVIRTETTNMK